MKLRPRRRKASESPVRKVKISTPLKKRKDKAGTRVNRRHRRSVKSEGFVEKDVEGERNQDEDPGPSNSGPSRHGCSRRQVSTVSRSSVFDIENGPGSGVAQLLEEVLDYILRFLAFADVKSARLVNKHWRQVATTLLRRSSMMIKLDTRVANCIAKMGDEQFPVSRFWVHLADPDNAKICLSHVPGICAGVKELTLSVDFSSLPAVQVVDDLATFPTDCVYKDLTHLNLNLLQRTDLFRESWKRFIDFVRSILEKSPILREVNVLYISSWAQGPEKSSWGGRAQKLAICPVIENLFPISNSVGISKLSYIDFEHVPSEKIDLAKWSTLNLKLSKLWLNFSCFSDTNDLLAKFLETQTRTLKDLNLKLSKGNSKQPVATFRFPKLKKLEQLSVTCNSVYAVVTFAGIDYARLFPSLKKLDLRHGDTNWRDFLGNDLLEPTDTVEELIFPWIHDAVHLIPNPAVIASKLFTGLKKLEIHADPFLMKAVYENMPNLEVLRFYISSSVKDDIITGLELEVCSRFRGVMTNEWIEKLQNAEGRSMARLQKLKTLKLSYCVMNVHDRLSISQLSFHVFKKMSSLKCLVLFDGRAAAADGSYSADEKQLLEDLRANFVVL